MATSFNVNLGIESRLGFKRPSGAVEAPLPVMQTTRTLNGETFADTGISAQTKILFISDIGIYDGIRTGTTSSVQPVTLTNYGNTEVLITATYLSANGASPILILDPEGAGTSVPLESGAGNFRYGYYSPISVPPSGSTTLGLSYRGDQEGEWSNGIIFLANTDLGIYKSTTRQIVGNIYEFDLDPKEVSYTFSDFEAPFIQEFTVTPYQGVTDELEVTIGETAASAFAVVSKSTSSFSIGFNPRLIGNVNGVYTATISVLARSGEFTDSETATLTVTVDITPDAYRPISQTSYWRSAGSFDNSVVGVSYDKIGGRKTITIGVGTGGNGVPEFANGGKAYADVSSIGRYGATAQIPYPGWANVYRIPVNADGDTTPRTYYSKDYQVKNAGVDYGSYFGDYESEGSMFIIYDDGEGNIRVELTRLRALSGNESIDRTLKNLTRALHYYSAVDSPSRYPDNARGNLDPSPTNAFGDFTSDGLYTHLFLGFLKNGRVVSSIVDLPKSI